LITSYEVDGQRYSDWFDFSQGALELVKPIVEWCNGWGSALNEGKLNANLLAFMEAVEGAAGAKIQWVSYGPVTMRRCACYNWSGYCGGA